MTLLSDIDGLVRAGESYTVEFKTSFNRETIESLVAFANAQGGSVAFEFDGSLQRKERFAYPLPALREALLNAVVGALSFVNRDIPDDAVVYGVPVKVIKPIPPRKTLKFKAPNQFRIRLRPIYPGSV